MRSRRDLGGRGAEGGEARVLVRVRVRVRVRGRVRVTLGLTLLTLTLTKEDRRVLEEDAGHPTLVVRYVVAAG